MMTRANPILGVITNPRPPELLSERATLHALLRRLENLYAAVRSGNRRDAEIEYTIATAHVTGLLQQLDRGVHANPRERRIARDVQAIVYIHADDHAPYVHAFGGHEITDRELRSGCISVDAMPRRTGVEAYYDEARQNVTLRHRNGKPLIGMY